MILQFQLLQSILINQNGKGMDCGPAHIFGGEEDAGGVPVPYLELFWVRRSWVGPVYLVIFSCWGGPIPYLELFWVGPVKKNHPVNQFKPGDRLQKLSLFRLWIRLHLLAVSSVTSEISCNGQRSSTHCELQRQKKYMVHVIL